MPMVWSYWRSWSENVDDDGALKGCSSYQEQDHKWNSGQFCSTQYMENMGNGLSIQEPISTYSSHTQTHTHTHTHKHTHAHTHIRTHTAPFIECRLNRHRVYGHHLNRHRLNRIIKIISTGWHLTIITFSYIGPVTWNSLAFAIRHAQTLPSFNS